MNTPTAFERPIILEENAFDALLFDCDGTLVKSAPAWLLAINHALGAGATPMPQAWYYDRLGLSPADLLDAFEAQFGGMSISRGEFYARCTGAFGAASHALQEVTVVAEVARAWHGRKPMAVVSNAQRTAVVSSLTAMGLLPLFPVLITIEDVTHGKPEPDLYLRAAEVLQVNTSRCLVLEDSVEGLTAASRAGMQVIDIRNYWTPTWKLHDMGAPP